MGNKNLMKVNGKSVGNENAYLTINLADDKAEVRGFGKPVTRDRAVQMAEDYFKACEAGWAIVQEIQNNSAYLPLKNHPGFTQLKELIDPVNQTVSGVFGKEIILQILSMRNCEGLRYVYGKDEGRNTVILIGVSEAGFRTESDGTQKAISAPVQVLATEAADIPLDGEVHDDSLTIEGVRQMLAQNASLGNQPSNVLFGPY